MITAGTTESLNCNNTILPDNIVTAVIIFI